MDFEDSLSQSSIRQDGQRLSSWLGLLALLLVASPARSEVAWQAVRGVDLLSTLADHELAGGVHFAYRLRSTGSFAGFSMGKEVRGTWRLVGEEFCWTSAKRGAEEECLAVERRGGSSRFLRDGYEAFVATVTSVKPPSKNEVPR